MFLLFVSSLNEAQSHCPWMDSASWSYASRSHEGLGTKSRVTGRPPSDLYLIDVILLDTTGDQYNYLSFSSIFGGRKTFINPLLDVRDMVADGDLALARLNPLGTGPYTLLCIWLDIDIHPPRFLPFFALYFGAGSARRTPCLPYVKYVVFMLRPLFHGAPPPPRFFALYRRRAAIAAFVCFNLRGICWYTIC